MPNVTAFHSIKEAEKPLQHRVYHNNSACQSGQDIPKNERKQGNGGYRLCNDCEELKSQAR